MQTYVTLKSILMALALIGAFGFFFIRAGRLYRLMRSVEGQTDFKLDRLGERVKILFTDVLGQSNVRRKPLIGTAHMLIFLGFLAIQPHSLMLMIQGVFPGFEPGHWIPGIYRVYLFLADILAVLVLVGLVYAIYRRVAVRPTYLTMGMDANLIILFTCVIVITFHLINAFQTLLPAASGSFTYAGVFPISDRLVALFNLRALSPAGIGTGYEIIYWIHIATILGFLIYIPSSKHLHLLAAIPNVFLKRLDRPKAIVKTDIEDEAAETFGLGKVSELNWKNVLNLYACTECGRCEEQCPASCTDKPLSPKKVIHDFKIDLLAQAEAIMTQNFDTVEPIVREGSPVTTDVIWSCTTCRACEDICPVNIEQLDFIIETRKHRVLMEADFPPEMQETFTNLENQFNPWGFSSDSRADWCKGMDVPLMADNPDAELLYFVGCSGSFDDRGKKIAQAMARVLQKADVNFAILGPEEACNGDVARRAGNEYIAQMLMMQNVEVLNQYKPKKILTGCPHCYNIIKNEYPQFGAGYEVVHHTELLLGLFQQGRLKASNGYPAALGYHDSCYLGRWNGIYQPPRDLLSSINGGAKLIEMPRSESKGFCCGAGGARMFMEETIGKRINMERAEEIIGAGAKTVAVACPFCTTMLRDGILEKESDVQVKDIVEIIDEAIS
ncbi:MAG: (Fe-S)-binding protein [Desulfobacterales bacterium]